MSAQRQAGTKDHLSKTIRVGLLAAIVVSALAHGAVEPWSLFLLEAILIILLLLWVIKVVADRRLRFDVPNTTLPIVALVVIGLAQSVAFTDSSGRWLSLSMNVGNTRATVTVLIFLVAGFLITTNFFSTRERLSALAHFLVIYGLAMAVFALVQHFSWDGRFYWLRPTAATSPFGPFANHNHFAGYMELLIPVPIALLITRAVRPEVRILCGFAAVVMGIAVVLSLSRGGIISLLASMMFLGFMSLRLTRRRSFRSTRARVPQVAITAAVVIALLAIISAGILWIGADPVINRVTQGQLSGADSPKETFFSSRGWVWRDTFTMIRANPLLGVGMGAYETAFPMYTESNGSLRVPQAHNDYLQVVADCGIAGGLIAIWFMVAVFRGIARGTKSADPLYAAMALGSGAGIFAILVNSLFDFNLQLPSNALLFLTVSAVATQVGTIAGVKDSKLVSSTDSKKSEVEPVSFARGAL